MRLHRWIGAALVCAGAALAGEQVYSQDKDKEKDKGGHAPTAEEKAEMDAFMAAATPGEHHKHLAAAAGEWESAGKMWMAPGAPPSDVKGKAKRTAILGGRYLVEEFDGGMMMGMPFFGHGIFGYDNAAKKHTGVWMDTMGTTMIVLEGTCEGEGCKKTTVSGTWVDPMNRKWGWKTVTTRDGKDKELFEGWNIMPEGMVPEGTSRDQKVLEFTYTRKK